MGSLVVVVVGAVVVVVVADDMMTATAEIGAVVNVMVAVTTVIEAMIVVDTQTEETAMIAVAGEIGMETDIIRLMTGMLPCTSHSLHDLLILDLVCGNTAPSQQTQAFHSRRHNIISMLLCLFMYGPQFSTCCSCTSIALVPPDTRASV